MRAYVLLNLLKKLNIQLDRAGQGRQVGKQADFAA